MPVFYGYTNAIFGTQSTVNGAAFDYNFAPGSGSTWRYTGPDTWFVVEENDGATNFNGDPTNEQVSAQEQIGGTWEQTVDVLGTARQIIYDYTFTVSDGTDTWRVSVIDVDLNNDDDLSDAGEDGYFLIFPDGMPPADTDLSAGGIVDNSASFLHANAGATVVCFAAGTMIATSKDHRAVETLTAGELVETRDGGLQPLRWVGRTVAAAQGDLAPIVISAGVLNNPQDLVVSPQHAVLLTDWRAEMFFGQPEVLVRAKDLLGHDGVYRRPGGLIIYYHLLFDAHHLVLSNGTWSESLYPGDMTKRSVGPAAQQQIAKMVPDLTTYGPKAAPCARSFEARCLTGWGTGNQPLRRMRKIQKRSARLDPNAMAASKIHKELPRNAT